MPWFPRDARKGQILSLTLLLTVGVIHWDFSIHLQDAVLVFFAALMAQMAFVYLGKSKKSGLWSAWITALSLTLLLRGNSPIFLGLAAVIAISSKFLLRWKGTHFFNPAALGIVLTLLLTNQTWVSPGQWGRNPLALTAMLTLGVLVLVPIRRFEAPLSFLFSYWGLHCLRGIWLGDSYAIILNQCLNGSVLLFAIFMISDPRTTPHHARARWFFGALIGSLSFIWQYPLYLQDGPFWLLIVLAPATPLLNHFIKGKEFRWEKARP